MLLGAYSPEISLPTVDAVFQRAHSLGFAQMQYDFSTSHGEEMPEEFYPGELYEIADAARRYGIDIVAVNGTFNMIDVSLRDENIRRFENIARACAPLGCAIVTLCTGSRHPSSMWRYHPDTALPNAWEDLIETTRRLLPIAERYGLTLGVETEASNVVYSIERTRRYLDEMKSPRLGVIMDCANLFPAGTARKANVRPTIARAFELLGENIVLAHGKDIVESDGIAFTAPGGGIVDYDFYFERLRDIDYCGGLILHGIHDEKEFAPSVNVMREKLAAAGL